MSTDAIRSAYEALATRDVDSLAALMHPEMEWRGRRSWRFWKQPPS